MYKVGDKVVYPHHGAGTVVKKETREVLGEKREYLTIQILHNDMTVNVPAENAEAVGLRKVINVDSNILILVTILAHPDVWFSLARCETFLPEDITEPIMPPSSTGSETIQCLVY